MQTIVIFLIFSLHISHLKALKLPDDAITYPEEPDDPDDPCAGLTYCTIKPKDYPQERFNEMFKNYKVLPQPTLAREPGVVFENRVADEQEQDHCESRIEYAPLYKVRVRREDAWKYAVQVPGINFTQEVRMETCVNQGSRCFTAFPPREEYVTVCKQKYISWNVLVVNDKNETELLKTTLPVCCSCHYKTVFPPHHRRK